MEVEQFKEFLRNYGLEWHWLSNMEQVYLFVPPFLLRDFVKIIGSDQFEDGGISCSLCEDGDIGIGVFDILLDHGIDPKEIFNKLSYDSDETF